ncbi:MAG: DUF4252 domain-containing protein [Bacteroidetes bacterium]|jgi:hypothetical protein|nr:DUF4252 domain-containing protein [Bacteroidota bacterium]MBT6687078.1 DUF4252 domain-containing protein [Bacteroidota bacterium]MBT7142819.1 DUF4252 domain-containing protein [Bacteroidota bacterium]MBT7492650.1 DUF4252 domain-containing protein [Bacteroidota bacterium]
MKTKLLIIGLVLFSMAGMTQSSLIAKYFSEYAENENFTKVSVNSKMFSLFTELESDGEAEKDFLEAISKIKGLKIIASDSVGDAEKLYKQACTDIDKNGYEELMTVEDAKENMKFSIKEENGIIEELIMVVGGKKNFVLLSLFGEIDLKNISKIARTMKIHGLENLTKIDSVEKK